MLFVLLINLLFHRPWLESFLFAVALAVGLTPELLPMVVFVTLARGVIRVARALVIVKRLGASTTRAAWTCHTALGATEIQWLAGHRATTCKQHRHGRKSESSPSDQQIDDEHDQQNTADTDAAAIPHR